MAALLLVHIGAATLVCAQGAPRPELLLQNAHSDVVRSIAFQPGGAVLASASSDRTVKLWDVATGALLRTITGHTERVETVCFSPDGRTIASASTDHTLRLWDANTGALLRTITEPTAGFFFATFSPDGRLLAAAADSTIKLFDPSSGVLRRTVVSASGRVLALAFSPDSRTFAAGATDVRLFDVATGRLIRALPGGGRFYRRLSFSPEGRTLAAAVTGEVVSKQRPAGSIKIWDVASGRLVRTLEGHSAAVLSVAFNPDGRTVASASMDKTVRLWDATTGAGLATHGGRGGVFGWVYDVAFSPDGRILASAGEDRAVTLWNASRDAPAATWANNADHIEAVRFSPDGRLIAVGGLGLDSRIELWEAAGGFPVRSLQPSHEADRPTPLDEQGAINDMETTRLFAEFSDIKLLAQRIFVDGRAPSRQAQATGAGLSGSLRSIAFSPDGRSLLAGSLNRSVHIWDPAGGSLRRTLTAHSAGARVLAFSPTGQTFASAGDDTVIKIWDAANFHIRHQLAPAPAGYGVALTFSPDGRLLASAGTGDIQIVQIWDAIAGTLVRTLRDATTDALAFSPDGRWLAVGRSALQIWDVSTGAVVRTLAGTTHSFTSLVFSPDGRTLAAGSESNIVLWDVATGAVRHTLSGHSGPIRSVAIDPTGKLLASGSDDTSLRFWDVDSGQPLATANSLNEGRDWLVTTPDGLFDGSPSAWNRVRWRFSENLLDTAPVELFFGEFYHPGLLAEVLAGKPPKAPRDIGALDRRQAALTLTRAGGSPQDPVTSRTATIHLQVTEAPADGRHLAGSGARDLRLFRNGALIQTWRGDLLRGKRDTMLQATIPIVAGVNRLTAYAFNGDNIKSADATLDLTGAEGLRRSGTAYVLAIGINRYANPDYNLTFAVPDARTFGEELARQQTGIGSFGRVEVVPLLDGDATKANILAALGRLAGKPGAVGPSVLAKLQRAQPEDAVFVYYAGHGTALGPRFYLIPHDLGYRGKRSQLDASAVATIVSHSISDEELERAFEPIDAGRLLLVIDACNSGQALEAEEKRRGPMNSKGLAQLAYEKGMYVLAASQGYQAALEVAQLGHGLLTYALVEDGLKTPVADVSPPDGDIVIREWLDFATVRVPDLQLGAMREARGAGRALAFVDGEQTIAEFEKRSLQRPRVFYRREAEAKPLVIAKTPPKSPRP